MFFNIKLEKGLSKFIGTNSYKDISIRCMFSCGRIVEGMNTLVH